MFVRITRADGCSYVKIVEAFRDDRGATCQRIIATLGRLEHVRAGGADALVRGLMRVSGTSVSEGIDLSAVRFDPALSVGDSWLLTALWHRLGFGESFRRVLRTGRSSFGCERLLCVMVFNRLYDPTSKLGVMRCLEGSRFPAVAAASVTHQRLLRAMDTLADRAEAMLKSLATLLRPLIDQELSVVFYDLTTVGVERHTELAGDVRAFGKSKDGGIVRQFMLGVVQTAEGLPIAHRVWEGSTGETTTLQPVIQEVLAQFPVKRVVLVADRGLLSLDNLEQLQSLKVRGGQPLEFVLAVPGRRYAEFDELLEPLRPQREDAAQEVSGEASWKGLRLIWAHDSERAAEQTRLRQARIDEIVASAKARAGKLDGQEDVEVFRGCRLSDSGAKAWMLREVSEANLDAVIKVDLTGDAFTFDTDECALHRARLHDGKLLLVTNVPDLAPAEVVERYKSLADIERGFKVLKSDIEIAPVFHQLPERIKAHALICILALVLHRVLRMQLKDAKSPHSPQRVLEIVKRIQLHQVILPNQERAIGVGDPYPIQREIFETLGLEVPTRQHLKTAVWCQK